MTEEFTHYTVMKNEAVEGLNPRNGLIYLDGTLGGGGHSELLAQKIMPEGRLISFDIDDDAIFFAKKRLEPYKNVTIVKRGYQDFEDVLKEFGIEKITGGMLLDLGASYYQLTSKSRGFSFLGDSKLDMRFDISTKGNMSTSTLKTFVPKEYRSMISNSGALPISADISGNLSEI